MKHYKDISSFSRDVCIEIPEHPLFGFTFGHKSDGSIDDMVFTADFYIISFQKFISGNITYGKKEFDHERGTVSYTHLTLPTKRIV